MQDDYYSVDEAREIVGDQLPEMVAKLTSTNKYRTLSILYTDQRVNADVIAAYAEMTSAFTIDFPDAHVVTEYGQLIIRTEHDQETKEINALNNWRYSSKNRKPE